MLRHSISQIFTVANNPSSAPENNMISTLQPNRPHVCPFHLSHLDQPNYYFQLPIQSSSPLNQQPSRPFSTLAPRTQMEALPPFQSPVVSRGVNGGMVMDAAIRHPVFFTDRLRKAPNGVGTGNGMGSPVTEGYVFEAGVRKEGGARL
jgi:hypothetical protein